MAGALFATFVALISPPLLCENRECGSLATLQTLTGLAGLVPAGLMVARTCQGRYRVALRWLALAFVIYAAWGLLNDALTHGWDDLRVLGWLE